MLLVKMDIQMKDDGLEDRVVIVDRTDDGEEVLLSAPTMTVVRAVQAVAQARELLQGKQRELKRLSPTEQAVLDLMVGVL